MFTTIFVDLDDTLVSYALPENSHAVREKKIKPEELAKMSHADIKKNVLSDRDALVNYNNNTWISRLRPYAAEFLSELNLVTSLIALDNGQLIQGRGDIAEHWIYVISYGQTDFAKEVLKAHGIRGYFLNVYGKDKFNEITKVGRKAVLIDDRPQRDALTIQKFCAYGALRSLNTNPMACPFVQVKAYDGKLKDLTLKHFAKEVKKYLENWKEVD